MECVAFFNPDALHDCSAVAQRRLFVVGGIPTLFLGCLLLATLFLLLKQPNEKMESAEWASSGVPGIGSTYKVLAKIPGGKKEGHGYTIDYPDRWLVTERAGEWESGDLLFQHAAGVDTISAPGDSGMVVIGAQQIPDGTTLDQWMNTNCGLLGIKKGNEAADQETYTQFVTRFAFTP